MNKIKRYRSILRRMKNPPYKTIHVVTYSCTGKADTGLCSKARPSAYLWNHKWKRANPRYADDIITGKVTVDLTGIGDHDCIGDACELNYEPVQSKAVNRIGNLIGIEFTDGSRKTFINHDLYADEKGEYLFVVNRNEGKTMYTAETLKSMMGTKKVILFWHSARCHYCQMMKPFINKAPVHVIPIDADINETLGRQFGLTALPTLQLYSGGRLIKQQTGFMDESKLIAWAR